MSKEAFGKTAVTSTYLGGGSAVLFGLSALAMIGLPVPAKCSEWWPVALSAGCALHPLAYMLLARYRLWAEARAYRIQLKHYPDDRSKLFARFLAAKYGLEITPGEAEAAIRG